MNGVKIFFLGTIHLLMISFFVTHAADSMIADPSPLKNKNIYNKERQGKSILSDKENQFGKQSLINEKALQIIDQEILKFSEYKNAIVNSLPLDSRTKSDDNLYVIEYNDIINDLKLLRSNTKGKNSLNISDKEFLQEIKKSIIQIIDKHHPEDGDFY